VTNPFNLEAQAGEKIWITGDTVQIKASAAQTQGAYTMIEAFASQEMAHHLIYTETRTRPYTFSTVNLRYLMVSSIPGASQMH
jgi:hypothetical protein